MLRRASYKGVLSTAVLAMLLSTPAYPQSAADCAARADRAARNSTSVLGGAATGAAGGAVVGAIAGKSKYVKRGAAIGAVAGGATQAYRKNDRYNQVYDDCMRGR
mgnify:FL=1